MADSGGKLPFASSKLYLLIAVVSLSLILFFLAFFLLRFILIRRSNNKALRLSQISGSMPLVTSVKTCNLNSLMKIDSDGGSDNFSVKIDAKIETKPAKQSNGSSVSCGSRGSMSSSSQEDHDIGWGRWYSLHELDIATLGFSGDTVVGEGGYGVVYRGVLPDSSVVAVKFLLNNRGQAEKEFKVEVEAIGKVRHKNLVGLIGYCAEGDKRMLVYEFVDNGNLEQWLHGNIGPFSPLTWDIRIRIAIGAAKGLAYLHEGLEPKVVHRDVKSSNILLDNKWNAKVSDFGLAKLLGPESSFVTTRVMGTFGYVSPEYASTGMLNETNDVYSFGVLLMEIITGRCPVDYSRPVGEMNLVEWFRGMVGRQRGEEILDPLIESAPSTRGLKRVLLVCLRCVDTDPNKRPRMGQVVHMLEADDFPYRSLRTPPPPSHL